MLIFVEGGKPENQEKNPLSKDENQQQTQPTYDNQSTKLQFLEILNILVMTCTISCNYLFHTLMYICFWGGFSIFHVLNVTSMPAISVPT